MFSKDNGTMFFWILVISVVALLVLSLLREHLENYNQALAEVGQTAGYRTRDGRPLPVCPSGTIRRTEDNKCVSSTANASPICSTGYQLGNDKKCRRIGGTETTDPTCPSGFVYNATATRCDTNPVDPTCPGGYTYKDGKCEATTPSASSSMTSSPAPAGGMASSMGGGTGPGMGGSGMGPGMGGGTSGGMGGGMGSGTSGGMGGGMASSSGMAGASSPATGSTAASATGGSSTSSWGPTSGGQGNKRLRQVFGPQFTGGGGGDGGPATDTSKTNVYPELLGGLIDTSSRIPGAGITAPSKNWTLTQNGSLPNSMSLGSDASSSFFPTSRTPGDMDIIPDPYRVAQSFSAASYSSKTEPVPFLTDFSAFQK